GRTGDRYEMLDAERIEQPLLRVDDVVQRDRRKIRAVRPAGARIGAGGIGRTVGRTEHVAGDDKQFVGVDRLARPDQPVTAAWLAVIRRVAAGGVVAAGKAVRGQYGIAAVGGQRAVGLIGERRLRHDRAIREAEIADREKSVLDGADIVGTQRRYVIH